MSRTEGALINRVMTTLIQKVKGDPGYVVDPDLAPRDLAVELRRRGVSLVRAQWKLRGVAGSRLRFAEPGVSITHRRLLTLGKGCVVEAHARFHCLSTQGFVFGDSVTIGKFSIIEGEPPSDGEVALSWHYARGIDRSVGDQWSPPGSDNTYEVAATVVELDRAGISFAIGDTEAFRDVLATTEAGGAVLYRETRWLVAGG